MSEIDSLIGKIRAFRDERNWEQFHNGKDLSLALSIEASELLELFLWKSADEVNTDRLQEELADVIIFALLIAEKYQLDVSEIVSRKLKINASKYPVEACKGKATKYSEL